MKLKKLLALMIACIFVLALAVGCNGDETPDPAPPAGENEPAAPDDTEPASPEDPGDNGGAEIVTVPTDGIPGLYVFDPMNPNVFTGVEDDDYLNFNFKDSGGAWVNLRNPWGDSVYLVFEPGEGFVQSYIVTFEVEGYDGGGEGYRTMSGFAINGWSPSLWSLDEGMDDGANWEQVFGEKYYFMVDGDGFYQIIIPMRAAMDFFEDENDWYIKDYLEGVDCIELGFYGVPEETTMKVTIHDVKESGYIYAFADIGRPLGSSAFFAESIDALPALPAPGPPRVVRIGMEDEEEDE
jgi:hypothetical protein